MRWDITGLLMMTVRLRDCLNAVSLLRRKIKKILIFLSLLTLMERKKHSCCNKVHFGKHICLKFMFVKETASPLRVSISDQLCFYYHFNLKNSDLWICRNQEESVSSLLSILIDSLLSVIIDLYVF